MTIDPVASDLDAETLRAVQKLIHGSPETFPELPTEELTETQETYGIQASVMATLSTWVEELENAEDSVKGIDNERTQ